MIKYLRTKLANLGELWRRVDEAMDFDPLLDLQKRVATLEEKVNEDQKNLRADETM